LDPPVLTICISTNDNEALYKLSSLFNQPSQRRSEHKLIYTLHPYLIDHNSKKNYKNNVSPRMGGDIIVFAPEDTGPRSYSPDRKTPASPGVHMRTKL
jgi:hypothetical protein